MSLGYFEVTDEEGNTFNMQDRRYNRIGVYGSLLLGDLNLIGVGVHGTDKLQLLDAGTGDEISMHTRSYDAWFAQADYVIVPPFQASLRYENLRVADPNACSTSCSVPGTTATGSEPTPMGSRSRFCSTIRTASISDRSRRGFPNVCARRRE